MTAQSSRTRTRPPANKISDLRGALLDLIGAVHDQEAMIGAQPDKSAADHALLAALFAARIGLQDQIVTLHKAEMLGKDLPARWEAALARACMRMKVALSHAARSDQLIASATDGIAAAKGLLQDMRDGEDNT